MRGYQRINLFSGAPVVPVAWHYHLAPENAPFAPRAPAVATPVAGLPTVTADKIIRHIYGEWYCPV